MLQSDNGLVFSSKHSTKTVRECTGYLGVHHTLYTRAERADGVLLPISEGGMHLAALVRVAGPCAACGYQ